MYPLFPYDEGALPFICYDEYRRNSDQLCTHSCLPVAEVLKRRDLSAMAPVISVSAGMILLPGESPLAPHQLMSTEFGKNFVHCLIKAIWSMVHLGIYIERIEKGNIFMCPSGNIKFHNVKILKEPNHLKLEPPVGLPSYFKLYDHLVSAVDELARDKILLSIHQYIFGWRRCVVSNKLLSKAYRPWKYQLSDKTIAERRNIGLSDLLTMKKENPSEYDKLSKLVDVQLLLEYLRNRTAHRMESWQKGVNEYAAEDADNGCIVRFRVFFARLQKEMHDHGVLSGANISQLFFFH